MNTGTEEEFYVTLAIYGAVISLGLVFMIAFGFVGIAIFNRVKSKKVIKQIYEQKERQNGHSKKG